MLISIIIPAYNEANCLTDLFNRIQKVMHSIRETRKNIDFEILVVDDGSTDNTLALLQSAITDYPSLRYISLSRSFGHQNALKAGIDNARGNVVVTMDADLQHPPEIIAQMLDKYEEGYDIVYTRRVDMSNIRPLKRLSSKLFYTVINTLSDVQLDYGVADFRLISAPVAESIRQSIETPLFLRGFIAWSGFRQYAIDYVPEDRVAGKSKYTLSKMFSLGLNGVTAFSIRPLRFATIIGFFLSALASIYALYAIIVYFISSRLISGWASVVISVMFIGGVQLIMLGIIGEYVGRTFIQSKRRPNYLIKSSSTKVSL